MTESDERSRLVARLQQLNGWRLWLLFSLATVSASVLIVSLMDLVLMDRITADYLLTGLVTAGIVAPVSLMLMTLLLREIARHQRLQLSTSVESAETRLRVALDSSDEGILMVAFDGAVLSANKRFFEMWRVPPALATTGRDDLLLGHVLEQLEDPQGFIAGVQRLYGSTEQAKDTLQFKDGRVFERYTRALATDAQHGRIWCFRDVSVQAEARKALAESEEHYRAIVSQAGDGIDLVDAQTLCFLEVNQAACRMLGYRRDELIGRSLAVIHSDLDEAGLRDIVADVLRDGEASIEVRHRCKDGRDIDVFLSTRAIRVHGQTCLVGVWRDIGERKEAERNLKMAVEVTQIVFWKLDLLNQSLHFDQSHLQILGLEDDERLTNLPDWLGRVHPDEAGQFRQRFEAALQPGDAVFDLEYRLRRLDGSYRWIHTRGSVVRRGADGRPELAVGTSMNITARKQVEQAARDSEQRSRNLAAMMRLMTDNVPDMIWAKDLEHRYVFANKAACRQLLNAEDSDEPVGKTDMFFALRERQRHPDDPQWHTFGELCQDTDAITLQRGVPSVFEESGHLQGRMTYLDVSKAPFIDEKGEVIGTVGSGRDITERKKTEAELERHRQNLEGLVEQRTTELLATEARATRILDSTADGLYGVDSDSRITFINRAACRMLGYTAQQVVGRPAHELFHHSHADGRPYPASDCVARQSWRQGRESRCDDETYWHADGHAIPVALASHPIFENGRVAGAVVSIVDVSLQRAATLAREQALVAAENLARARSEFLANMSHEVRTPMNGVLGFAKIGLRRYGEPARARDAFEKILASGNQLLGVVNEILDFSKIDAGKLQLERTEMSINEVLDSAIQLVADRAGAKGLPLRLERADNLPPSCVGDPLRIGQVLLNLLTNAIKFTDAGTVTLSAERDGGQLVFRVADTGIGMTAEQLGYVFNPFQQADGSITRKFGGTGLGLAICKRLVELMHGEIRVESSPGLGSVFEMRLPYVPPAARPRPHDSSAPRLPDRALAGLCILVAEDDPVNQAMLQFDLSDEGARPVIVGDGAQALERVVIDGAAHYDVVLMDIQMPFLDGYEATRRILKFAPDLPIVAQTAHAFDEDREKCLAAGMAGYIAKPIDRQALVELVLQVVKTRRPAD